MPHSASVSATLDAIEEAMKMAQLWQTTPPTPEALASVQPFCCDTLAFEQWVQWVLLSRLRALIEGKLPLPTNAAIAPMAEEVWCGQPRFESVTALLRKLDAQLTGGQA